MFNLERLFHPQQCSTLPKDKIAELLRTNPEALAQFEASYAKYALGEEPGDVFHTNSRQASEKAHTIDGDTPKDDSGDPDVNPEEIIDQIVQELLTQTTVYHFDGKLTQTVTQPLPALPEGTKPITPAIINRIAPALRPQLTGNHMMKDINADVYPMLLENYMKAKDPARSKKSRELAYHMFRQGLDIMDLDPVMYEMLGMNQNAMGYWLPKLVNACMGQDFFKIPATTIAKVPITLLQLTRQAYDGLTPTTLSIVDKWAMKAFDLDVHKDYFVKTGTYSSKFDFRNCKVTGEKEVRELGEYLLFIHFQANQMASPLTAPACIYGVSTTNEWVVRDFISDKDNCPTIYKGLPLHTEYRVFIDCDTKRVIGVNPYWDPVGMKSHFNKPENAENPHMVHDYISYAAHEPVLMERYNENVENVLKHVQDILPGLDLPGQWSVDVMQNGNDFWIIDMAIAAQSTFYECVPPALRRPVTEEWLPNLGELSPPWSYENLLPEPQNKEDSI